MRILVVTTRSPWPLVEGRALRTFNLIRQVARRHEIILCTYVLNEAEVEGLQHLREFCTEVHGVPLYMGPRHVPELLADLMADLVSPVPIMALKYDSYRMRRLISRLMCTRQIDLLHLDMLHLAGLLPAENRVPVVLVEHNVESELVRRRVANEKWAPKRFYWRRQLEKLLPYERQACRTVDHVVAVSDTDAQQLRQLARGCRVSVVPNAVDTEYFSPAQHVVPNTLAFVGGLSWFPNVDAVDYLVREILPLIVASIPDVNVSIVGHVPGERLIEKWRGDSRVRFLGQVEDIRPIVRSAAAYVVPLRIGGGTRLKILDALSMGKAVISTSVGCEGLAVEDGTNILVGNSPEIFAAHVVRALRDASFARRLGAAGRTLVETHYRWSSAAQEMESVYRAALATGPMTRAPASAPACAE